MTFARSVSLYMEKFLLYPSRSAYMRRMRTHMLWMVQIHMLSLPSTISERRTRISFAALLVKVMARMDEGRTPFSSMR